MSIRFAAPATLALLSIATLSPGQAPPRLPGGITMEMIRTALPEEGAPRAVPGPYEVVKEAAFGAPGLVVFRPASLGTFPQPDVLPVVAWGNGGCAIDSTPYSGFLTTIASHGFLVLATAAVQGAPARQSTADDLRAAIDWAAAESKRDGSPLRGKVATQKVGVMGQSCGGFLSITLGADHRVGTISVFNAGIRLDDPEVSISIAPAADALQRLHGPVLLVNGHDRDFMTPASKATFEKIDKLPVFYGALHNAGHTATVFHPGGGEYANVASDWLMWTLKDDAHARATFVGPDCRLCKDSNWDVRSKNLTR